MQSDIKRVSLTPAVFHLHDKVNAVSRSYGAAPIVPRGPRLAPLLQGVRSGICEALGASDYESVLMTGSGTLDNQIRENRIGTDRSGSSGIANRRGIQISNGATDNTVTFNLISVAPLEI